MLHDKILALILSGASNTEIESFIDGKLDKEQLVIIKKIRAQIKLKKLIEKKEEEEKKKKIEDEINCISHEKKTTEEIQKKRFIKSISTKMSEMRFPYNYQVEPLAFVKHVLSQSGGTYTLRLPRQSGKNEILAFAMSAHLRRGVGDVLIFAPSFRQTRITYRRLQSHGNRKTSEGHIFHGNRGDVYLVTASPTAEIVGLSATAGLIIDEAQNIDEDVFHERLLPMTASTNAPVLLIGTACAQPENLLLRYRSQLPPENNFQMTADEVTYEPYQAHIKDIIALYGRRAPFVRTQYYQEDLDASAILWFDPLAIRISEKTPESFRIVFGIDLGGVVGVGGQAGQSNDRTEIVIAHLNGREIHLMQRLTWNNIPWAEQERRIRLLLSQYQPTRVVIDARGVGEMLATNFARAMPSTVEAYKASRQSISSDLYTLGSVIQRGELYAADHIRDALIEQINKANWEVWSNASTPAGVSVDKGVGGSKIDLLKAVTYVCRSLPRSGQFVREGLRSPI